MSTMTAELRTMPAVVQLRDVETTDTLTRLAGRAVPYGEDADIGWFLESFAAGSLGKSIKEAARALPLLMFHDDRSFPIGAAESWDEKSDGLYGVWRLDRGDTAQRAAQLAKDGFLNFMSIRFQPIRSMWTYAEDFAPDLGAAHKDTVLRQEARLLETSLVSTPAYAGAAVEWVRSGEPMRKRAGSRRAADAWRAELERLRA